MNPTEQYKGFCHICESDVPMRELTHADNMCKEDVDAVARAVSDDLWWWICRDCIQKYVIYPKQKAEDFAAFQLKDEDVGNTIKKIWEAHYEGMEALMNLRMDLSGREGNRCKGFRGGIK